MGEMVLVMIDECGDEVEVERFQLQLELDEDELEIWQERKIAKAEQRYPEARGFYFEDRRNWNKLIAQMMREEDGYYLDPGDEDDALMLGDWD